MCKLITHATALIGGHTNREQQGSDSLEIELATVLRNAVLDLKDDVDYAWNIADAIIKKLKTGTLAKVEFARVAEFILQGERASELVTAAVKADGSPPLHLLSEIALSVRIRDDGMRVYALEEDRAVGLSDAIIGALKNITRSDDDDSRLNKTNFTHAAVFLLRKKNAALKLLEAARDASPDEMDMAIFNIVYTLLKRRKPTRYPHKRFKTIIWSRPDAANVPRQPRGVYPRDERNVRALEESIKLWNDLEEEAALRLLTPRLHQWWERRNLPPRPPKGDNERRLKWQSDLPHQEGQERTKRMRKASQKKKVNYAEDQRDLYASRIWHSLRNAEDPGDDGDDANDNNDPAAKEEEFRAMKKRRIEQQIRAILVQIGVNI